MEVLHKPSWWVPALLFLAHQLAQYGLGWSWWPADAYLDPLLFLPLLLGLLLAERRWLFGITRLTAPETLLTALVLVLIVEEGFPRWHPAFVRDVWDYPAYALGLAYFWWAINPRLIP